MNALSLLNVLAAATTAAAAAPREAKQPHLIVVLADDLGFYDTALYNPTSPTPTLSKLVSACILRRLP